MPKFKIELLPGASEGDRQRATALCHALDELWPELAERMLEQVANLLEADRRILLSQVQTIGESEVAQRIFAAVLSTEAERLGPHKARINFALNREDSNAGSRNCKAAVDRLRRLLQESAEVIH